MQTLQATAVADRSDATFDNQRRGRRVDVDMSAEITIEGGAPQPVQVTNLSETGCYIRSQSPPPVESRCEVKLFYKREQPTRFLEVAGRVAHRQRNGFGFEFTIIDSQTQSRLARLVG